MHSKLQYQNNFLNNISKKITKLDYRRNYFSIEKHKLYWKFPTILGGRTWHFHCRGQVWSLVWEIRFHKLQSMPKGKKNKKASQVALVVKSPSASSGDIRHMGLIPGSGRSPGGGYGNPFQYSCLENLWTEEPGGLQSIALQRVRHDWSSLPQHRTELMRKTEWIKIKTYIVFF